MRSPPRDLGPIAKLWMPVSASTLPGEIKEVPHRPYQINVSGVLTRVGGSKGQFRAVAMPDLVALMRKDIARGPLRFVLVLLPLVVAIVRIGR